MIRRIRKALRFESKGVGLPVHTAMAGQRAVQVVSGIELQSRLRCQDFQDPATVRVARPRGEARLSRGRIAQDEILVVAARYQQLMVRGSDIGAGRLGRAEIERGSGHTADFAERDLPVVGRQEMIRTYLNLVAVDVAGPAPARLK